MGARSDGLEQATVARFDGLGQTMAARFASLESRVGGLDRDVQVLIERSLRER